MQKYVVFLVRVQRRRKESSRSLSHLLMSFLSNNAVVSVMRKKNCLMVLVRIFDEVCRTVDASGNDVAFATIESSTFKRSRTVCLPIHAMSTPTRRSPAVDLRRWEMHRFSTAVQ